jgi:predicted dehydrogenase
LSHEIDYLHWFFGKSIDIQAQIINSRVLDINVEDQAHLLVTSEHGYSISVQIDFNRRHVKRECTIITSKGELTWNAVRKKVTWKAINEKELNYEYNNVRDDIYQMQLKKFFECIENNSKPAVTIEDGINVVRMIDAARDASISGSKVFL